MAKVANDKEGLSIPDAMSGRASAQGVALGFIGTFAASAAAQSELSELQGPSKLSPPAQDRVEGGDQETQQAKEAYRQILDGKGGIVNIPGVGSLVTLSDASLSPSVPSSLHMLSELQAPSDLSAEKTIGSNGVQPEPQGANESVRNAQGVVESIPERPEEPLPEPVKRLGSNFLSLARRGWEWAAGTVGIAVDAMAMIGAMTLSKMDPVILSAFSVGVGISHAVEPMIGFGLGWGSQGSSALLGSLELFGCCALSFFMVNEIRGAAGLKKDEDKPELSEEAINQRVQELREKAPFRWLPDGELSRKLTKGGVLGVALAGPIQMVTNDAFFSGFGKIPMMEGLSTPEFIAANLLVGAGVYTCVQLTRRFTGRYRDQKLERMLEEGIQTVEQEKSETPSQIETVARNLETAREAKQDDEKAAILEHPAVRAAKEKIGGRLKMALDAGMSVFGYFAARSGLGALTQFAPEVAKSLGEPLMTALPFAAGLGVLAYMRRGPLAERMLEGSVDEAEESFRELIDKKNQEGEKLAQV